jgi:hypothetical protein
VHRSNFLMRAELHGSELPSLADAVYYLEVGVGRYLLAVQEEGVTSSTAARVSWTFCANGSTSYSRPADCSPAS